MVNTFCERFELVPVIKTTFSLIIMLINNTVGWCVDVKWLLDS